MRLRTTGGVSAATQSPPETTSPGWHGSEEKTIDARAAAHERSSPDLNAGQGRPLQTRVVRGRSDVPRWQREPDAPERIAINLGAPNSPWAAPPSSRQPGIGSLSVAIGFGHRGNESCGGIGKPPVTTRLWSWALHTPSAGTPGATAQRRLALRCQTYMPRGVNTAPPTGWNQLLDPQRRQANKSEAAAKHDQARCGHQFAAPQPVSNTRHRTQRQPYHSHNQCGSVQRLVLLPRPHQTRQHV